MEDELIIPENTPGTMVELKPGEIIVREDELNQLIALSERNKSLADERLGEIIAFVQLLGVLDAKLGITSLTESISGDGPKLNSIDGWFKMARKGWKFYKENKHLFPELLGDVEKVKPIIEKYKLLFERLKNQNNDRAAISDGAAQENS